MKKDWKQTKRPKATWCDNIGSTGDGMLPVSYQEQVASMSYPRAMGSFIQTKMKEKMWYLEWIEIRSWLKKNTSSESAHW